MVHDCIKSYHRKRYRIRAAFTDVEAAFIYDNRMLAECAFYCCFCSHLPLRRVHILAKRFNRIETKFPI